METKVMPNNLDLERQVLASCFIGDTSCFDTLKPEHFYNGSNQIIFNAMQSLVKRNEPLEVPLVAGELKTMGKVINPQWIADILDYPPTSVSSRKIIGYYQLRETIKACHACTKRALNAGPDDASSVSGYIKSEMNRIDSGSGSDWCQLNDVITNCMDSAEELAKKGGITGVPTGFRDLDWYTSGFQGGDLVILAARPGMGKTAFAINSINNSAKQGFKAGFLSLEMVAQQVGNRFLSITSNINALKFRSGRFLPDDWEKMVSAAELLSTHGVWIDDHPRASYQDIHSKCKVLLSRHHANALWIDYLGFIDGDKDQNKVAEIQSITRALKQSAKEFNIPIVLICQLSRECEKRPNKRPILSDLRDSGAIEQDADVVLFLYREDYYKPDSKDKGVVEVSISKQRNGPTGTIKLQWQEEYTSFHNLAKEGTYYAQ
jgi:replicative DNA helicase